MLFLVYEVISSLLGGHLVFPEYTFMTVTYSFFQSLKLAIDKKTGSSNTFHISPKYLRGGSFSGKVNIRDIPLPEN